MYAIRSYYAGTNAVEIANQVIERFESLKGTFVPEGVNAYVTRNYGQTAEDKAQTLIKKLVFATLSVITSYSIHYTKLYE